MINKVELVGYINEKPTFAYKAHGNCMYRAIIEVPRTSGGHIDKVQLTITELQFLLIEANFDTHAPVEIKGAFTSHNYTGNDGKRHLELSVRVEDMSYHFNDGIKPYNNILLEAILCRQPVYRKTPMGKEICDLMLAHNRSYIKVSDYIPAVCWGKVARNVSKETVGTRVTISGRIQSRTYSKVLPDETVETRTAYEVSANSVLVWTNSSTTDDNDFEDFADLD